MASDPVSYFIQASEFTSFHKKLALILEPWLNPNWDLADIGCGLALLDFELVGMVRAITAIDEDESAIEAVRARIAQKSADGCFDAENITPLLSDISALGERSWDVVLISFYGDAWHQLNHLLSRARHRAIILVHGRRPNGTFDVMAEQGSKMTAVDVERFLVENGYRFRKSKVELQFGQPFKTIADIHEFLHSAPDTNAHLDPEKQALSAEERIVKTDRYDYPFYLPKNIGVGIFIVVK